ncbi:hypothetical protein AB833_00010 [Chromatiales bacterium (ex Bugula neritina AB1)]|nr:hypothetical protein AB833_00010 [Chromatiales bacterium (ex Bugula neritina AB1)]
MTERFKLRILTGFLGAGKTTLLNEWLSSGQAEEVAVLINEFGAVDVDGPILDATLGEGNRIMSLPNGCICCEVQEDLVEALTALADSSLVRKGVLETTGLADPGAILSGVAHDPRLKSRIDIAATICVAGANTITKQLADYIEVRSQLALADRIVLSKTDLLSSDEVNAVQKEISALNPLAEIRQYAAGSIAEGIFDPVTTRQTVPESAHHHSHGISTFSVTLPRPLNHDLFRDALSFWIMRHSEKLLRMKGIVRFDGNSTPQLLNAVHDVFTSRSVTSAETDNESGGTLVFIGRELPEQELRVDLERCMVAS